MTIRSREGLEGGTLTLEAFVARVLAESEAPFL